jgi:hypothetical protein
MRARLWTLWTSLVGVCIILLSASGAAASAATPFHATALWISSVPEGAAPAAVASAALADGAHTLYVKAGDGSTPDPQFSPTLVRGLRAGGVSVCGWIFVYGVDPLGEAAAAVSAVHNGAQCLVIDAEGQYDGRYGAAQIFVRRLRAELGRFFPIGLAGQAEVADHPTFPYSVFLGPGGFNFDLPQIYWQDLGLSVDRAFLRSIGSNAIYGRPEVPVGQLYGSPPPAAVARFRSLATAYGCDGLSFFNVDSAQPADLLALQQPLHPLPERRATLPTLRPGADGDEVVWAQELLNAAGARLPVGGFYGAQTARAVARFQARHRLAPTGVVTTGTWIVLRRLTAREPSWAKAPPLSGRTEPGPGPATTT